MLTRRRLLTLLPAAGAWALEQALRPRARVTAAPSENIPIYLTFDDGIETKQAAGKTGPTLDVLDLLDARGIQATFFVHGHNTGEAEGYIVARMIETGHRVGNHLFQQGGVTLAEQATPSYLAKLYLDTEIRLREVLAPFPDALARYLSPAHPHLFRRPGGGYDNPRGNLFLLPDSGYWDLFAVDPYMAYYRDKLDWLKGVYDYSGWHINPLPMWTEITRPEEVVWWTIDAPGGLLSYLHPSPVEYPAATSQAALDGIIILLHDPDERIVNALPLLLDRLDEYGAAYHVLPRPVDQSNSYTIGIGRPPEIVLTPGTSGSDTVPIP